MKNLFCGCMFVFVFIGCSDYYPYPPPQTITNDGGSSSTSETPSTTSGGSSGTTTSSTTSITTSSTSNTDNYETLCKTTGGDLVAVLCCAMDHPFMVDTCKGEEECPMGGETCKNVLVCDCGLDNCFSMENGCQKL